MDDVTNKFIELNNMMDCVSKYKNVYLKKCSTIGRMECALLDYLSKEGKPEFMNTLSKHLAVSHSRITRIVDNLVKKNMVTRFPDPEDRRRWCTEITQSGLEITSISSIKEIELQNRILEKIPEKKIANMEKQIREYYNVFLKELGIGESTC